VTGGYSGVGYELTKILFQKRGTVYIAGRCKWKADKAISRLMEESVLGSRGQLHFLRLDLADLSGICQAAEEFMSREDRLDVLTNNAGVMAPSAGSKTKQASRSMPIDCC
jgi:NAD(P)-dependent dehydrogenase (short-subunit alcohol dehydrogenase family)